MKITFIQTGGTIDKDYPKSIKGWAFEIAEPAVGRILKKLNPSFEYELLTAFRKDSLMITAEDRTKLLSMIEGLENDKIIITHGTDTLIETAHFLKSLENKTIILTGAMKPERFYDSDAPINIGLAIGAVSTMKPGIYIAMHGIIARPEEIKRNFENGKYYA